MILITCSRCIDKPDTKLKIYSDEDSFIIECLECGDMKRYKRRIKKKENEI